MASSAAIMAVNMKTVHPFFSRSRQISSTQTAPSQPVHPDDKPLTTTNGPTHTTTAPLASPAQDVQRKQKRKALHAAEHVGTSCTPAGGRGTPEVGNTVSVAMPGGQNSDPLVCTSGAEEDIKESQRKRARSASPLKDTEVEPQKVGMPFANVCSEREFIAQLEEAIRNDASLIPEVAAEHADKNLSGGREEDVQDEVQSTRAMLQLRGDGKLAGPVPRAVVPKTNMPSNFQKTRTRPKQTKSLIVTISYRGSPTADVGQRIGRILCGQETVSLPSLEEPFQIKPKAEKTQIPKKPTHPFFLGQGQPKVLQAKDHTLKSLSDGHFAPSKDATVQKLGNTSDSPSRPKPATGSFSWPSRPFGSLEKDVQKQAGLKEPPFPWKGCIFVEEPSPNHNLCQVCSIPFQDKSNKGKDKIIHIPKNEDVLHVTALSLSMRQGKSVPAAQYNLAVGHLERSHVKSSLRVPRKLEISGPELCRNLYPRLSCKAYISHFDDQGTELCPARSDMVPHPAIFNLCKQMPSITSAFDHYCCENLSWTHKYAPKSAEMVLQSGMEAFVLRNWLSSLKISAVHTGKSIASNSGDAKSQKLKTKKRKRCDDMDDFVISDDEMTFSDAYSELDDDSSAASRPYGPSIVRKHRRGSPSGQHLNNAILLSGPQGCGKSAAVYAVAKELGYEIFEISPNRKRSAKEILDQIGDMTENHLVQQVSKAIANPDISNGKVIETVRNVSMQGSPERQGSMKSFFKPSTANAKLKESSKKLKKDESTPKKSGTQQKQSLILFEEVDILFEDDKQFWVTILALASHCKRPVILTCIDENLVRLDAFCFHAILRFVSPPTDLAVDYLLLIAAAEGHLLARGAVEGLYIARQHDLRASLTELNFWCQMGVGDPKNGLNWILDRFPKGIDLDDSGHQIRAISVDTYLPGMGFMNNDLFQETCKGSRKIEDAVLAETWSQWGLSNVETLEMHPVLETHNPNNFRNLAQLWHSLDTLSTIDISTNHFLRPYPYHPLDSTHPPILHSTRRNFPEGYHLLHDPSVEDFSSLSNNLTATQHILLSRLHLTAHMAMPAPTSSETSITHTGITAQSHTMTIVQTSLPPAQPHLTRTAFHQALDPLAYPTPSYSLTHSTNASTTLTPSILDREFPPIPLDVAPYARCIARAELAREAAKADASGMALASGTAGGGAAARKKRMTRASRAAGMEAGTGRGEVRRERWWGREMGVELWRVVGTGGTGWEKCLEERMKRIMEGV